MLICALSKHTQNPINLIYTQIKYDNSKFPNILGSVDKPGQIRYVSSAERASKVAQQKEQLTNTRIDQQAGRQID